MHATLAASPVTSGRHPGRSSSSPYPSLRRQPAAPARVVASWFRPMAIRPPAVARRPPRRGPQGRTPPDASAATARTPTISATSVCFLMETSISQSARRLDVRGVQDPGANRLDGTAVEPLLVWIQELRVQARVGGWSSAWRRVATAYPADNRWGKGIRRPAARASRARHDGRTRKSTDCGSRGASSPPSTGPWK